ncbi:ABC transporter permease [Allokutzneria oryzae]|uniref:ABC transporter permease n=1 Tax=Allokutzneria oryzae TaxID=1378989 RepID=A0ABV5ZVG1_9PSEU
MITDNLRAELFALRRRPGVLAMAGMWSTQVVVFAYLVPYVVYLTQGSAMAPAMAADLLSGLLPEGAHYYVAGALPTFGGPVMLVIGALLASGDYRWGTLRTILGRQSDRFAFLGGRFLSLLVALLPVAVVTLVLGLLSSGVIAAVSGGPANYSPGSIVLELGALWLVMAAWGAVGFAIGVLTRSPVSAIVIGLLWTVLVENAVTLLANVVPGLGLLSTVLLGNSSNRLAMGLGSEPITITGAFGVSAPGTPLLAVVVLLAYVATGFAVSYAALRRRDVS